MSTGRKAWLSAIQFSVSGFTNSKCEKTFFTKSKKSYQVFELLQPFPVAFRIKWPVCVQVRTGRHAQAKMCPYFSIKSCKIKLHLTYILRLEFTYFKLDWDKTFEFSTEKEQINSGYFIFKSWDSFSTTPSPHLLFSCRFTSVSPMNQ